VSERQFRDPSVEMLVQWINAHCQEPEGAVATVRPLIDAIQTSLGTQLLRNLPRTRAYHAQTGQLDANELLVAGHVVNLVRQLTGMGDEPGQPIERPSRRTSVGQRLRGNR
jgi:2-C-methyl-D-erythritol 4-phosphate cytidylyltransferase